MNAAGAANFADAMPSATTATAADNVTNSATPATVASASSSAPATSAMSATSADSDKDPDEGQDTDPDEELYERFFTLQAMLRDYRFRVHMQGGPLVDATRGQGRILALLKLKDGMRTRELAKLMGIRVSSLNETLGKMEHGGYIVRKPYEKDKRVILISLTEKGRRAKEPKNQYPSLFEGFSDEEREQFGQYLDRMIGCIEKQGGRKAKTIVDRERRRREAIFARLREEPERERERMRRTLLPTP